MSILHSSVVHLTDLVRSIIGCAARHSNASRYNPNPNLISNPNSSPEQSNLCFTNLSQIQNSFLLIGSILLSLLIYCLVLSRPESFELE